MLRPPTAEQMTVAMARHPFRASKMTLVGAASAIQLEDGIDAENETSYLAPVGVVGVGIEKSQISDDVLFIVGR